jgi:hypothetical protein
VRKWLFPLTLFLVTPAVLSQDAPPRPHPRAARSGPSIGIPIAQTMATSGRHLIAKPTFATVFSPQLLQYATSSDVPDFNAGFDGSGVALTNSNFPRNKYAVGIQTDGMDGGGCVPVDPAHPYNGCVMLTSPSGTLVQAQVAREIWTFRISYIDPTSASAAEVNIGFAGGFGGGNSGDYSLEWVRRTTGGHRCFTFYPCDFYGLNLDYLTGTAAFSLPTCTMKIGAGYHAYVYYQASPYDEGAVPAGAQEWYPATTAATTTKPGGIIWQQDYALGRADNALAFLAGGLVNPDVPTTGYPTAAPTITGGAETVTVQAYDCGALPNVAFTIDRAFEGGGGHVGHATPSLDAVSSLDAYSGTTNTSGTWTTTLHGGTIGSAIQYTASSQNVEGSPFTAEAVTVSTGFVGLIDPGPGASTRYTGQTATHPNNHNGSVELHLMLRDLAEAYNAKAAPDDQGSLGLNDMSLPIGGIFDISAGWSSPHARHRFGTDCDIDRFVQKADGSFVLADSDLILDIAENDMDGVGLLESGGRMHVQVPEYQVANILLREVR